MLKAAPRGNSEPSLPFASLERSLDRTIEFLSRREATAEAKALLIEARRLRSVVANWRSIPPAPDVHDEMLDRVLQLSTQAGAAVGDAGGDDDDLKTEIDPGLGGMLDEQTVVAPNPVVAEENTELYALDFEPRLYALDEEALKASGAAGAGAGAGAAPGPGQAGLRLGPGTAPKPAAPAPQPPPERPVAFAAYPPMDAAGFAPPPQVTPAPAPYPAPQASPYAAYPPAQESFYDGVAGGPIPRAPAEPNEAYPPLRAYPPVEAYSPEPRAAYPSSPAYPPAAYPAAPTGGLTPTTGRRAAEEPPVNDAPVAPDTAITVTQAKLAETLDPNIVLLSEPYGDRADVYRAVRRKLASSNNPRVIAVTSPGPGEGKTIMAINLALAMREGARGKVLLLEANVRAPGLSKMLGFEVPACFAQQITSHREDPRQPWIVVEPLPQIHVLAVDPNAQHPPLLDPVAFSGAMERLKRAGYEYIIVDTPPVIGSFEVNMIADTVEGVIFSAITMKSKKSALRKAIEQVMPAPVLGVLVLDA